MFSPCLFLFGRISEAGGVFLSSNRFDGEEAG
jgi:hypothetical protein